MAHSKNFDLIIKAAKKAKVKLKVYGSGLLEDELRGLADDNIEFLGRISDEDLIAHYKGAKAFIVAQKDEDFGITLVEAQASGCPVIAYNGGGYKEAIIDGKTGIFFDELTVDAIVKALNNFAKKRFVKKTCIDNAKKFSSARFEKEIML